MSYVEDFYISKAGSSATIEIVEKVIDKYKSENEQIKDLLDKIKHEIEEKTNSLYNIEFNDSTTMYIYSSEIVKFYNKNTKIGIAIKAEFENESLVNIEGFALDFNKLKLEDINEEEAKEVYDFYKKSPEGIEEQVVSSKFSNKNLCDLNFNEIKNNFIQKRQEEEDEEDIL